MPPPAYWGAEWLNWNSQRAYPFFEEASRTDISDSFTIPNSLLLGLYLPVHVGLNVDPSKFFVRSLVVSAVGLNIGIGYDDGTSSPPIVASTVVPLSTHIEYQSYALPGVDGFDDIAGKVVIGLLDDLQALPAGQYLFTPEAGRLDVDAIRPIIRGVSSITIVNGGERSARLTGDLHLTAGTNTRLTTTEVEGVRRIRIDAIDGEGLNDECVCDGDVEAPSIKTINGIPPTSSGNFSILGDTCIEVDPISNGVRLSDSCSSPCCGCTELAKITTDLMSFGDSATTLTNFLNRLEAQVNTMSVTVLGSRLNDVSCQ